ncbi:MAG: hypothetical protein ACOYBR_09620 [Fluviibacter sp.]
MSTQSRDADAPQKLVEFLDLNRNTIKALFILPTERNAPIFVALASWIDDDDREPVRVSGLRAFVDSLDEAMKLRLPVSTTPVPLPAIYARLQRHCKVNHATFSVREDDENLDLIYARAGDVPGVWTITHAPTDSVVGHIGEDACFRVTDPRPDDIMRQATIQRAINDLRGIQRIEALMQDIEAATGTDTDDDDADADADTDTDTRTFS